MVEPRKVPGAYSSYGVTLDYLGFPMAEHEERSKSTNEALEARRMNRRLVRSKEVRRGGPGNDHGRTSGFFIGSVQRSFKARMIWHYPTREARARGDQSKASVGKCDTAISGAVDTCQLIERVVF
jgi:hypothetical protein